MKWKCFDVWKQRWQGTYWFLSWEIPRPSFSQQSLRILIVLSQSLFSLGVSNLLNQPLLNLPRKLFLPVPPTTPVLMMMRGMTLRYPCYPYPWNPHSRLLKTSPKLSATSATTRRMPVVREPQTFLTCWSSQAREHARTARVCSCLTNRLSTISARSIFLNLSGASLAVRKNTRREKSLELMMKSTKC